MKLLDIKHLFIFCLLANPTIVQACHWQYFGLGRKATALVLRVSDNRNSEPEFIQLSAEVVGRSVCYIITDRHTGLFWGKKKNSVYIYISLQ